MNALRSIIVVLALAGSAGAQPPHPEPPANGAPHENDPAAMKARLERWLEETRHREEVIVAALKRLNEGASPDDVRKSMEPGARAPRGAQNREGGDNRPRREGPGAMRDPGPPMDREQVLAFIDKQNPEFAARMRTMAKDAPDAAERVLSRLGPQIHEIQAERDDQTREIRTAQLNNGWEVMAAVRSIREATKSGDAAARAKAVDHARALLGQGFDLRVRLHEREVTVLEDRLAKLKQGLVEERSGRDNFVAERLRQVTEPRERRDQKPDSKSESGPAPKLDARTEPKP